FIFFLLELPVGIFIIFYQSKRNEQDSNIISLSNLSYQNVTLKMKKKNTTLLSSSCIDATWAIVNIMMYTNHVINFISYCMTGSRFRSELYQLIVCGKYYCVKLMNFKNQTSNYNGIKTAYLKSNDVIHEKHRSAGVLIAFMLNGTHKSHPIPMKSNKRILHIRRTAV
ncbi:unnamed protein product, partial [Didymodactylos carnosus]